MAEKNQDPPDYNSIAATAPVAYAPPPQGYQQYPSGQYRPSAPQGYAPPVQGYGPQQPYGYQPQQGYGAPGPAYGAPQGQQAAYGPSVRFSAGAAGGAVITNQPQPRVVIQQTVASHDSVMAMRDSQVAVAAHCPHCKTGVTTDCRRERTMNSWLMCFVMSLLVFLLPCAWMPLFCDQCKLPIHYCPDCKRELGRYVAPADVTMTSTTNEY